MGSAARPAVLVLATSALGISLIFCFDFAFLVFFWLALTFVAIGVPFDARPTKVNPRHRACLVPSGGGVTVIHAATVGDAVGVYRDERWKGAWRRRVKVMLAGVLGLKQLGVPFCMG